jgi:uncharacterized protein (UPF0548 family)
VNGALWERPVSYAAVGATRNADLLRHPPIGYRPLIRRRRIGHGDARFEWAWVEAMTWGIQRRAGFRVRAEESPPEVTENSYIPITFDEHGEPARSVPHEDVMFGPDGTAMVKPGDTVTLFIPFAFIRVPAPARVVYVLDEAKRRGFAYGTVAGHPEDGEEAFIVEQRRDGSVWVEIRAFSRPSGWFWWVVYPVLRLTQAFYTARYLRALAVPLPAEAAAAR